MLKSLGSKAAFVAATTAVGVTLFAGVALAAPVLPAGMTSGGPHDGRGNCGGCHTFSAPVTPPVVTPPVVTPPVVTPPVVTPPVVTPPVVTPPVKDDDHDGDDAKPAHKKARHGVKHTAKRSKRSHKVRD